MRLLIIALILVNAPTSFGQTDTSDVFIGSITKYAQPNGGIQGLANFVNENMSKETLKYIRKNKISCKILVMFIIGKDGFIQEARILKGLDPILDEEILRIFLQSKWTPAYHSETPVKTRYTVPFNIG